MTSLSKEIISKSAKNYIVNASIILVILTILVLGFMIITGNRNVLTPMYTSIIYNVAVCGLYIYIWTLVAKYSPDSLLQLYLGGTGLRLITAMFVCLTYCYLVPDKPLRMTFALVFCFYYIVMLIFDTVYFIKLERVNRL